MSGARVLGGAAGSEGAGVVLRWAACLVLVLGLHAGAAWLLLRRSAPFTPPPAASEAVMLDLAPVAPQPAAPFSLDPMPDPGPKPDAEPPPPVEPPPPMEPPALPAEPAPPPEPAPPTPSLPQPAVVLPEPPLPMPKRPARPPPPRPAQASPPRPTPEVPAPSAAPASAPPLATPAAPSLSAFPGWQSELSNRLQRAKRYPNVARARDEQGAAAVAFTVDRSGHVLSAKLVRSSGSPSLDEEAVAMVRRADPLPPMPADMPGSTATMTVPVTFSLQ